MTARRMLFVILSLPICWAVGTGSAAPVPKEKPMLTCELHPMPDCVYMTYANWEVVITNTSGKVVDIPWKLSVWYFLELKVQDSTGGEIKTDGYGTRFSPYSFVDQHLILKPGESIRSEIALLSTVPKEILVPGTYKVKAIYTFEKKSYESKEVEVKWPQEAKKK